VDSAGAKQVEAATERAASGEANAPAFHGVDRGFGCRVRRAANGEAAAFEAGEHNGALGRTGRGGAAARSEASGTEPRSSSSSVRYRSSLQAMIFVIDFSCLSRGPDDQSLSCGHRESSSSEKGLSDGGWSRRRFSRSEAVSTKQAGS
jgi:hypothetical protein